MEKLNNAKVAVFGIGGVGGYVVEALVRAGIQNFILVDGDKVDITNLNRQIIATQETVGMPKVQVCKDRILSINPNANVEIHEIFFLPESKEILNNTVSYVVDCVDTVTAKLEIIMRANKYNIPIISCMGAGNKIDPTKFEVTDIYNTTVCHLAKVMRKELRKMDIKSLKVVYSKEEPKKINENVISSISFVPSVCGLIAAGEVIKALIKS